MQNNPLEASQQEAMRVCPSEAELHAAASVLSSSKETLVSVASEGASAPACSPSFSSSAGFPLEVRLRRDGYDPFIDFLKGFCIVCVVLTHCMGPRMKDYSLFQLWGYPAVPLFLILQVFHAYKRGLDGVSVHWNKLWHRILKPFLLTQLLILSVLAAKQVWHGRFDALDFLWTSAKWAGRGPGAYYPWVYVQFAVLLPLLVPVFRKLKGVWLLIFFIVLSQLLETMCSLTDMPFMVYRLLFFRYTFLFYLGYALVFQGYKLTRLTLFVSLLSIAATLVVTYTKVDLSPLVHQTGWRRCQWFIYIFMAYLLVPALQWCYLRWQKHPSALGWVQLMGRQSYEVFLFQMFYFACLGPNVHRMLMLAVGDHLAHVLFVLVSVPICLLPILRYRNRAMPRTV